MNKICRQCQAPFTIMPEDIVFYDKVSPIFGGKKQAVPPPTLCPDCRQQRRLSFRNERNLYKRTCDLCQKNTVSIYSPNPPSGKPYKAYCGACWWSDKWDPMAYGRNYDFNRPFFEQLNAIKQSIPHLALLNSNSENSDYTHLETNNKNCFMNFGGHYNEDCYYNLHAFSCKNCVDSYWIDKCEKCYECFKCFNCYNTNFSYWCFNCSNCSFCFDCKSCTDCFGCTGLRQKKYCFFNEQLTKEEYEKRMQEFSFTPENIQKARQKVTELWVKTPHAATIQENSIDSTGDMLKNCKNCKECYEAEDAQDCKWCEVITLGVKDCYDTTRAGFNCELAYENMGGVGLKNVLFSDFCFDQHYNSLYIDCCISSQYLFGCTNLRNKKYCILNKQYTKEEYEKLVPQMIEHMKTTGEWGEFFPVTISPFGYNETVANEYFPLTEKEAQQKGFQWSHYEPEVAGTTQETIQCKKDGKLFKVIPQEREFYREKNLPLPHLCSSCRHGERLKLRNPRKLYPRQCAKCTTSIETTYAPSRPEVVYCEACYLKEVY